MRGVAGLKIDRRGALSLHINCPNLQQTCDMCKADTEQPIKTKKLQLLPTTEETELEFTKFTAS